MYTFDHILRLLPDCDTFPLNSSLPPWFGYVDSDIPVFVPPSFSLSEGDPELHHTQVIIISAAGAVGKSTVAKALAFRKSALLWDLAAANEVGEASLDGMLLNSLAAGRLDEYWEYLSEGFQLLVIDALDEGRIKVTENAFRRLLENIARRAQNAAGLCFVLLGRARIAEEAWLILAEQPDLHASIINIEPFDKDQANAYLDSRVGPEKLTPQYNVCRELIFDQLAFSVSDGSRFDAPVEFLHYPPVLDVVARVLIEEDNPMSLRNYLSDEGATGRTAPIQLLASVIDRILKREQEEKVVPALRGATSLTTASMNQIAWSEIYSRDEQCQRLLASVLNIRAQATPRQLPEQMHANYEQTVSDNILSHPILQGEDKFANSVFQSYLFALALSNALGEEMQMHVTRELLKREYRPNRLLAEFYFETLRVAGDGVPKIAPEHVGLLYDSLLSSESDRYQVRLIIDGPEPLDADGNLSTELVEGEFEFWARHTESQFPETTIDFVMDLTHESTISFTSYIRDATVTVPCVVELGHDAEEFQIGPAVRINARKLSIGANSLIVGANTRTRLQEGEATNVVLEALTCEWNPTLLQPIIHGGIRMFVSWPGARQFPWSECDRLAAPAILPDDEVLHPAYMRFKRIVTTLQAHKRGSLARMRQKIEHRRVLQNELGSAILEKLRDDGILYLGDGGRRYFWDPEKGGELLGVSWQDLRNGVCPESLREYLSRVVE